MRGTVAKKCRKILWALQIKKQIPEGSEYRINRKGEIRAFGSRAAYKGLKKEHRQNGGFLGHRPRGLTKQARELGRREKVRASKRRSRQRRKAA